MNTINSIELEQRLSANPNVVLLDVRTPVEFEGAHIDGSINIPLDQLKPIDFFKNNERARSGSLYLICQRGSRASNAANLFEKAGILNTVVLEGGVSAWIDTGFKVKRGSSKIISLERQVRIAAGSLVLLGVILSKLVHPAFIWLSAFVGAGLINAGITDWCGMGILLTHLPWNKKVCKAVK